MIHLYILGYRGEDILSFDLKLNNPSKIAQMQELEFWKAKFEASTNAKSAGFSEKWVSKNILAITEEEFIRYQERIATFLQSDAAYQFSSEFFAETIANSIVQDIGI